MNAPPCPYLVRETTAYRESLDLSRAAQTTVVVRWHCTHPFHGIRLDLGEEQTAVEEHCAACALPRPAHADGRRAAPSSRRDVHSE
jgi:hypothetical protein